MAIVVTYNVNKDLYYASDTNHSISLVTTEYEYKTDILVHLQIGKNLSIRLNNIISYSFNKDTPLKNEQFMFRKTYQANDKIKQITRSTFEDKLRHFSPEKTAICQEIVEDYIYTDKNNHSTEVQIAIMIKSDTTTAVIDFKDPEQFESFVRPVWLLNLSLK